MFLDRMKQLSRYREHVYADERIAPRPDPPEEKVPAAIRSIRTLEDDLPSYRQSRELIFIKQARLMERYEDDQPYSREVVRYYPTYQSLNNAELRGYFTWRTQLRKGDLQKTSLSFAFLYMYELINQIGCSDPLDGFRRLQAFRETYGALDDRIFRYMDTWLRDYVIYYDLDRSLLPEKAENETDHALLILMDLETSSEQEILDAFLCLSSYPLDRSRFYKLHAEEFSSVLCRVLKKISDHYGQTPGHSWMEDYFGSTLTIPVRLFPSAVFYGDADKRSFDYAVNPLRIYHDRGGRWSFTYFDVSRMQKNKAGNLLRTIDALMREDLGFKHPIKPGLEIRWVLDLIHEQIAAEQETERLANRKELKLDLSVLDDIRRDAAYTRDRLITQDEQDEQDEVTQGAFMPDHQVPPAIPASESAPGAAGNLTSESTPGTPEKPDSGSASVSPKTVASGPAPGPADKPAFESAQDAADIPACGSAPGAADMPASDAGRAGSLLDENELHYLNCLLDGSDLSWVRQQGLLPSILADSINEKLFDLFADTVLDEDGVIPDYLDELKEMI